MPESYGYRYIEKYNPIVQPDYQLTKLLWILPNLPTIYSSVSWENAY